MAISKNYAKTQIMENAPSILTQIDPKTGTKVISMTLGFPKRFILDSFYGVKS